MCPMIKKLLKEAIDKSHGDSSDSGLKDLQFTVIQSISFSPKTASPADPLTLV